MLTALGFGMGLIAMIGAGSLSVWQRIAPPHLRGRMSAIFGLVSTGSGATLGPLIPALITDHCFGDTLKVGWSLTIVLGLCMPAVALSLAAARRELARTTPLGHFRQPREVLG